MASGIQDIPMRRIPEQWDPQWFRDFVRDVLRLGDARNINVGDEFELSGQSDEVATLGMALGGIGLDKIEDQPGLSVLGNPDDSVGTLQALIAGSDLMVMRRFGLSVGFGILNSGFISDFQEAAQDATVLLIDDSANITWAYDDPADSLVGTVTSANPTASVGLAAVNGIAASLMRSDAAPALDQSIAPTWSAVHTFSLTPVVPNDSWAYAKIQNASALSVLGRASNSVGDLADIVAGSDGDVLRRSGATIGFGSFVLGTANLANPTASLGLSAVNGTAVTAMRSDGAPALSQSIAPTWSGQHTFSLQILMAAAGVAFSGDTNTSIGSATADTIEMTAGGVISTRVSSQGVGVGGKAAFNVAFPVLAYGAGGNGAYIAEDSAVADASRPFAWWRSNAGVMELGNSNRSGVGTTGSTVRLSIAAGGDATFTGQVTGLRFVPTSSTAGTNSMYLSAANELSWSTNSAKQITLTSDGRLYGISLHNNAGAVTGTTNQYVASGTYTPTLSNVANLAASTAYQCQWMRVGNVVTVSGKVDVDPTLAATSTQLGISLPIASNLANAEDCAGAAAASGIAGQCAAILADTTNDRAQMQWISGDITNQPMYFTFTYEVL